jgi:hypothetical protein
MQDFTPYEYFIFMNIKHGLYLHCQENKLKGDDSDMTFKSDTKSIVP